MARQPLPSARSPIRRIKFATNFPKDMTRDLLEAVRDLPKVSPYLHVPAQSGSNRILEGMKRGYTVEDYREMMGRIRELVSDAAVTSDFIVGFCGETDEEFQRTYELARECRFVWEFRGLPGVDPKLAAQHLQDYVDRVALPRLRRYTQDASIEIHRDVEVPGLEPDHGSEAEVLAKRLTGTNAVETVSFVASGLTLLPKS